MIEGLQGGTDVHIGLGFEAAAEFLSNDAVNCSLMQR
jgi:hypothetical protein